VGAAKKLFSCDLESTMRLSNVAVQTYFTAIRGSQLGYGKYIFFIMRDPAGFVV
jgi:hypothetical protein